MSVMVYGWREHKADSLGDAVRCDMQTQDNVIKLLQGLRLQVAVFPGQWGKVVIIGLNDRDTRYVSRVVYDLMDWKLGIWNASSTTWKQEKWDELGLGDNLAWLV